jgi:2-amino-4-hydroxy-6-hydroxymethyldihydropteridine diphosphokinase/dihydropteroate synthase
MNLRYLTPDVHRAFIALGSNVGDRVEMIEQACLEMDKVGIKVKRTSSLFETAPMYVLDQDTFINGVCEVCSSTIQQIPMFQLWKLTTSG